jgi:hypothetical protein
VHNGGSSSGLSYSGDSLSGESRGARSSMAEQSERWGARRRRNGLGFDQQRRIRRGGGWCKWAVRWHAVTVPPRCHRVHTGWTSGHGPSWAAGKQALDCLLNNQRFSNVQTLKFENVSFPMSKIHQTSQGDSLKHKEQISYWPNFKFPQDLK